MRCKAARSGGTVSRVRCRGRLCLLAREGISISVPDSFCLLFVYFIVVLVVVDAARDVRGDGLHRLGHFMIIDDLSCPSPGLALIVLYVYAIMHAERCCSVTSLGICKVRYTARSGRWTDVEAWCLQRRGGLMVTM